MWFICVLKLWKTFKNSLIYSLKESVYEETNIVWSRIIQEWIVICLEDWKQAENSFSKKGNLFQGKGVLITYWLDGKKKQQQQVINIPLWTPWQPSHVLLWLRCDLKYSACLNAA